MGEVAHVASTLRSIFPKVDEVSAPATLEGGDVLQVGSLLYVGLSQRTNLAGIDQLSAFAARRGIKVEVVRLREMLHLKTGVSALPDGSLLLAGELVDHAAFAGLPPSRRIIVPDAEAYAANCVSIRGRVLLPAGFPATRRLVAERGWPVEEVDLSEFRKVDGGASCLSLRF
mmetsp:Transcript_11424/g.31869  ORF Transcript_11424/g.31869 Transcript_11424/m.31869 type:complete len:172 (-) Transcript_11424:6-521(-)